MIKKDTKQLLSRIEHRPSAGLWCSWKDVGPDPFCVTAPLRQRQREQSRQQKQGRRGSWLRRAESRQEGSEQSRGLQSPVLLWSLAETWTLVQEQDSLELTREQPCRGYERVGSWIENLHAHSPGTGSYDHLECRDLAQDFENSPETSESQSWEQDYCRLALVTKCQMSFNGSHMLCHSTSCLPEYSSARLQHRIICSTNIHQNNY